MAFDHRVLAQDIFTNLGQAGAGVAQSEIKEVVYNLVGDGINSFPKAARFLAKWPKFSRRVGAVALLGILKAKPDIFGAENVPYVNALNEVIESFAEGVGRAVADVTEEHGREMAAKVDAVGRGQVRIRQGVAHRGDGNCLDLIAEKEAWVAAHPSRTIPGGKDKSSRTIPGDPFPEISIPFGEAVEQGATPCLKCMRRHANLPEWARPAEPPKLKDWWEAYSEEERGLIAQLPELFGEEAADLLDYMKDVPTAFMKPVLARYNNEGTLRLEVVPAIRNALFAWTLLDKTAKDKVEGAVKAWLKKNTPEGRAALQTAKEAGEKGIEVMGKLGVSILFFLLTSLSILAFEWATGHSAGLALMATAMTLLSFLLLLAFVFPLDALVDIIRGLIERVTGWQVKKIDLDKVKNGLKMTAANFVIFGALLVGVIYFWGEGGAFGRAVLFLVFLLSWVLSLVLEANFDLLSELRERLTKEMAFALYRILPVGILVALTGWLISWGNKDGAPRDGREVVKGKVTEVLEAVTDLGSLSGGDAAVAASIPAQHMWGHIHEFWVWVLVGSVVMAVFGGMALAFLGAQEEGRGGIARGLRAVATLLAIVAVAGGLLTAFGVGVPLGVDRLFGFGETEPPAPQQTSMVAAAPTEPVLAVPTKRTAPRSAPARQAVVVPTERTATRSEIVSSKPKEQEEALIAAPVRKRSTPRSHHSPAYDAYYQTEIWDRWYGAQERAQEYAAALKRAGIE